MSFGMHDAAFQPRTPAPIAYLVRDDVRYPVYGVFAAATGTAAGAVVAIDGCIIHTDGASYVDLLQAEDDYPDHDSLPQIPMRKYHDLVRYIDETKMLQTIARAWIALDVITRNDRIIFVDAMISSRQTNVN